MPYSADHVWDGGDFIGASLQSLNELFVDSGHRLICCNAHSGVSAFFVRGGCSREFADVPADLARINVGPRYRFFREYGHGISRALPEHLLGGSRNASS